MRAKLVLAAAALALAPAAAPAAGLDGSKALVCDLVEAAECDGTATCTDVTPAQIDLPGPLHVDFAGKRLHSSDEQRTSPIVAVEAQDAVLLLLGHDGGRGWTLVIDRATGHLSATVADAEGSFALAGACTPK
jgi:hypothetical protein